MAIENERKNEDLYLGSVHHIHNDRDKSDTVNTRVLLGIGLHRYQNHGIDRALLSRERKLDWLSKPRPMALLHKESFA